MSVRQASTLIYSSDEPDNSYGRCTCGRGFMVLDEQARSVDATCNVCGYSERVHCCDDCAYGPLTVDVADLAPLLRTI